VPLPSLITTSALCAGSQAIPTGVPIYCRRPRIFGDRENFEYRASPIGTAHHDLPNGTTSTQTKESFMKMHLVMAAAFAGLCSHAAFARYDGGDTWSELQPQPASHSAQALATATTAFSSSVRRNSERERYDGGDTWSQLEPKPYTSPSQSLATTAPGN
jgi:hypothetical protein